MSRRSIEARAQASIDASMDIRRGKPRWHKHRDGKTQ
jgi:hypothetical protein